MEFSDPPEIVVIGHATVDVFDGETRPGGPGPYASLVASRLGLRTALLTSAGPEVDLSTLLPAVDVVSVDAVTAVMRHSHAGGVRVQHALAVAGPIGPEAVPDSWRSARLLLLAPLLGEVDPALPTAFPRSLVGANLQGWLRRVLPDRRVAEGNLDGVDFDALAGRVVVVALSEQDLGGAAMPSDWIAAFPIIILTRGREGLRLHHQNRWWRMQAFPVNEVDATGAGDSLSAAFLVRYAETGDVDTAARFAAATSSFVVEAGGFAGAPSRQAVEERIAEHPWIALRPDP